MERRKGQPIEKQSDTDTVVQTSDIPRDEPVKELDPFTIGNVRRGLEDQLEQNDNNLDGVINNIKPEEPHINDDNANGIPDDEERRLDENEHPEKKESLLQQLRQFKDDIRHEPHKERVEEMVR